MQDAPLEQVCGVCLPGDGSQWSTDREFGRQVVAGMHPCQMQALSAEAWAEKQSAIGDEHVQALLGCTLQAWAQHEHPPAP